MCTVPLSGRRHSRLLPVFAAPFIRFAGPVGAYAARPFLRPVLALKIVVVSRLRKDACLYNLPGERDPHQRGKPPVYGKNKISLAKRAGHREGWQTITYDCRGVEVTRQYKTFLATSELVGGQIRVVILRYEDGSSALTSARTPRPKCVTSWKRLPRAGRSRNTSTT